MNISKNILSLGLIAVISGISTAQTYTATAGTNGVTDIQSDYSMSTGDGASVSVDVPLEFELPKKVAIAIRANGTGDLPADPMFDGILNYSGWNNPMSSLMTLTPHPSYPEIQYQWIGYKGAIYANTAVTVTAEITSFNHETDPNSFFEARDGFVVHTKDAVNVYEIDGRDSLTDNTAPTVFPVTGNLDDTYLMASDNKVGFFVWSYPYLDTIESTDRAGKYTALSTITVSTL